MQFYLIIHIIQMLNVWHFWNLWNACHKMCTVVWQSLLNLINVSLCSQIKNLKIKAFLSLIHSEPQHSACVGNVIIRQTNIYWHRNDNDRINVNTFDLIIEAGCKWILQADDCVWLVAWVIIEITAEECHTLYSHQQAEMTHRDSAPHPDCVSLKFAVEVFVLINSFDFKYWLMNVQYIN